jgi:hypothetical protein
VRDVQPRRCCPGRRAGRQVPARSPALTALPVFYLLGVVSLVLGIALSAATVYLIAVAGLPGRTVCDGRRRAGPGG